MKEEVNLIKKYRKVVLRIVDICLVVFACYLVLFLKYDNFEALSRETMLNSIMLNVFVLQLCLTAFDCYKNIISSESGKDYLVYSFVCLIAAIIVVAIKLFVGVNIMPVKDLALVSILISVMMITYRVIIRMLQLTMSSNQIINKDDKQKAKNLLIIGAR